MSILESLIIIFSEALSSMLRAGEDKAKQEDALMAAEEKLSRLRAKQKFG